MEMAKMQPAFLHFGLNEKHEKQFCACLSLKHLANHMHLGPF